MVALAIRIELLVAAVRDGIDPEADAADEEGVGLARLVVDLVEVLGFQPAVVP